MTAKPPPTQRTFVSAWDEIEYLYHKILYWFYQHHDRARAQRFCDRLLELLQQTSAQSEAILGQACWSLLYEVKGDLLQAIGHREREIELIKKLWRISKNSPPAVKAFVLRGYDWSDLADRLDLLAILYHDRGDLNKALRHLRESKRLCQAHGIPFDGQELFEDYLAEKQQPCIPQTDRALKGREA